MRFANLCLGIALLGSTLVAACGGGSDAATPEATALPISVLETANSQIRVAKVGAVKDAVAWAALWAEHKAGDFPQPALPAVDFSQKW